MSSQVSPSDPKDQLRGKRKIIGRIVIAGVVAIALFGGYELGRHYHYWGEPDELRAIKSESIARTDLLGLELMHSEQKGQGEIITLKTQTPSVTREFKVQPDGVEATKQRIVNYVENDGWIHDPDIYSQNDNKWLWRKQGKKSSQLTLVLTTTQSTILIKVSAYENY